MKALRDYEPWFQALLEDLAGDTQEAEEVMRRTLASMQRTQSLVESIRSTTDFSEDAPSRREHYSDEQKIILVGQIFLLFAGDLL